MAERVRARRRVEAEPQEMILQESADAPCSKSRATVIEEDRNLPGLAGASHSEPTADPGGGIRPDRGETFAASLSSHPDQALLEVEVRQVQPDQFADSKSASVQRLEHRPIANPQVGRRL